MNLEPSREDFARRDAAGLCVACGENPQPARKDSGDSPTHHRCDPCWKRYQSLKNLRDRMLGGEGWGLAMNVARPCGLCGQNIPDGVYSIFTPSIDACLACVEAAGFIEALEARGAHLPPLLQHAAVDARKAVGEGMISTLNFIAFTFPPAMPAMIGLALHMWLHMMQQFIAGGVQCMCVCLCVPRAVEFKATVEIGSKDQDGSKLVSAIALELVGFCARVTVPRAFYRAARNMVYETHGNPFARRVKRS